MSYIKAIVVFVLLTFSVPSNAESRWRTYVPDWIETIADSISDRIDTVAEDSVINRYREKQVTCIALAVYYESRGEPVRGQKAVAAVVMNRAHSPKFPDTPCKVVFQSKQFSFVGPRLRPKEGAAWNRAIDIGNEYVDKRVTEIPYLFFNSIRKRGFRIGNHVFY